MAQRESIALSGTSVATGAGRVWGRAARAGRAKNCCESMPSDVERLLDMLLKQSGKNMRHRRHALGYVSGGGTLGGTSKRRQVLTQPLRRGMRLNDADYCVA